MAPCCGLAGGRRLADQACAADCPALRWKARSLSTLLTAAAKARSATLPVKLAVRVLHNGTEVEAHRPPRTLGVAIGALRSAMLGNSYFVSVSGVAARAGGALNGHVRTAGRGMHEAV